MTSGIGDGLVALFQFLVFTFISLVATLIILLLTIIFGWTQWFLVGFVVSTFIAWLVNRRIV